MSEYMENQMDQQIEGGIYAELEQACKEQEVEIAELKEKLYTRDSELAGLKARVKLLRSSNE